MARIRINRRIAEKLRIEADQLYVRPDFATAEVQREWKIRFQRCYTYLRYGDLLTREQAEQRLVDCGKINAR